MKSGNQVPASVWLGLWLAITLDTGVQLCWKIAVSHVPPDAGLVETALATLKQPLFLGVIVMFVSQLVNWLKVLANADLSYAQPITSLSYVSVCVLSAWLLKERLSAVQVGGIALVLLGVWFISQTEHKTGATGDTTGSTQDITGSTQDKTSPAQEKTGEETA